MKSIGFIGCGNMGSALATAVCAAIGPENVYISDKDKEKTDGIANKLHCKISTNEEIASFCDYIFLAVKPQLLASVLSTLRTGLSERNSRFVFISMAAGVNIAKIKEYSGADYPTIRIMPNLAVSAGSGMTLFCTDKNVSADEKSFFSEMMRLSGLTDEIEERLIDAGSAISGCGPAFAFMFSEALADGGVRCGLPRNKALLYAEQMLRGSAEMLMQTSEHPEKLKDAVCSPAGSTIEGVKALEDGAFRACVSEAVYASYLRTAELGK